MARKPPRRSKGRSPAFDKRARFLGSGYARRMWFESLEERVLLASDLDTALQTIIKTGAPATGSLVDALHDRVFERALNQAQPLIANALQVKDTAFDQLNALSGTVQTALASLSALPEVTSQNVADALSSALGSLLREPISAPQLVNTDGDSLFEEVLYTIKLQGTIVERTVPFDLGLPSVLVTTSGNVDISLTYEADLVIGFSVATGVFLDTAASNEFRLELDVTTPDLELSGKRGILPFVASNVSSDPEEQTGLDVSMKVDFTDANNRLTTSDIGSMGVTPLLQGDALVNLRMVTNLGSAQLPSITADIRIDWHHAEGTTDVAIGQWGDAPQIQFSEVGIDIGSFFQNLVLPVFEQIDLAIAPVQPVLDLLSERVPILSEIVGEDVTIAELAATAFPFFTPNANFNIDMLVAVVEFYQLYEDFNEIAVSGVLPLGAFDIDLDTDVRHLQSLENVDLGNVLEIDISDPNLAGHNPQAASFVARTHSGAFGGGFAFPILESPITAFELILGKDVEVFRLDFPVLSAGFEVSAFVPIFGIFGVQIAGSLTAGIDLGFGYDTSGLRQWSLTNYDPQQDDLVFDGFFLRDRKNGVDIPEAFVQARIEVTASVDVGIAEAGIGGAIIATVGLNLRDRVNDGRLHPSEIQQNIIDHGPICGLFEFTGSLDAALTAYVEVGIGPFSATASVDILTVRLVDFTFDCTMGGRPVLAELDSNTHELTLYTGPLAYKRYEHLPGIFQPEEPDVGEIYIIRRIGVDQDTGLDILQVEAFGEREVFVGVSKVIADGGAGDDIIQLGQTVAATAEFTGGAGNDRLVAGSGGGTIYGNEGNDDLGGSGGALFIYGEEGNDILHGGSDTDVLYGGDNDDIIFGNGGDDFISAGAGIDIVHGGLGVDTIFGGDGDDDLRGDEEKDIIFGDGGNDLIRGGDGDNELHGGADNDFIVAFGGTDQIWGDDGNDEIHAGGGIDIVYGGSDDDLIHGEDDNDELYGDAGVDTIDGGAGADVIHGDADGDFLHGGTGEDLIFGDDGGDTIHGNEGNDTIRGGIGADTVYGDEDDDEIYGEAGADMLHGDAGRDRIWGGTENDTIWGDDGVDALYGEEGDDEIYGGADDDLILGGIGSDTLSGDRGSDRIYGGLGNDTIYGHAFSFFPLPNDDDDAPDFLYGEEGDDSIAGDGGNDYIDGGVGVDSLFGNDGDDTILAGTGVGDQLYGGSGDDFIVGSDEGADSDPNFLDAVYFGDWIDGGSGNDTIHALGGADYILGGSGDDWINSGFGSDWILGGADNDYLYAGRGLGERIEGENGDDVIYGSDEGLDTLYGGAGQDEIYGQGGNDFLSGDGDDDYLDGGAEADMVFGGLGNDTLLAGGNAGDVLHGEDGSDVLHASPDAATTIFGGAGRDTIHGGPGADTLHGGDGDDLIDGGAGDDTIYGDEGIDLLLGGANHDTIYGHNASGAGDDNAVDYIYGDFGTERNEVESGRDRLFGQGGNDLLYGEGDDDFLDVGSGTSNLAYYGSGESGTPSDFVTPIPTPPPTLQTFVAITHAAANLPTGVDSQGRWSELAGSGSRDGFSQSFATAQEQSLVVSSTGATYAAWVDGRHGNYEIYVARHVPGVGWQQLAGGAGFSSAVGSASEGGVSNTTGSSRRPSIVIGADGQPIVAWTEYSGSTSDIRVAKYDPTANGGSGGWVALGTSLGADGISGTGAADSATLVLTAAGPVVAWLDSSSGVRQVYARQFSAGVWNGLGGAGFASGTGISQAAANVTSFSATTDGTNIAVAWSAPVGADAQVFLRDFSSGTWNQLGGSAAGNGVSNLAGSNLTPTVAYLSGTPFVAWQGNAEIRPEIYVKRFTAGAWQAVGGQFGISATQGIASQPRLVSGGGQLHLIWADDARANRTGTSVGIFATKWNGATFAPEFALDARTPGIANTSVVESLGVTVDSAGRAVVSWSAPGRTSPQVFLLSNSIPLTGQVFTATAANSVQSILDANNFGAGDVIQLSAETLAGFTVAPDDSGVLIVGVPGALINGPVVIAGASDVTLQSVSVNGNLSMNGGARNAVVDSILLAGIDLANSTDVQVIANTVFGSGVTLSGELRPTIERNSIITAANGVTLSGTATTDATIRQNFIAVGAAGILLATASSGNIRENEVDGGTYALDVQTAFAGPIERNEFYGASVGVRYVDAAGLTGNQIHDNATGVVSTVATTASGLGYVIPAGYSEIEPNSIYANTTGVQLSGVMQKQHIYNNQTGVVGSGSLTPADFDHANLIERNVVGADFTGSIQFNEIAGNTTGIVAKSGQLIAHNLIYRNSTTGIHVTGKTDVRIVSNTLYSPAGDLVRIDGASKEVQLTGNAFWAEQGYDIYVDNNSQTGFWSDYNLLHASGTGKLVSWSGYSFTDILDWQEDVARFDLHSMGHTIVNPDWSEPRFASRALDDYRTSDLASGLRFSNPAVNSGDPIADLALPSTATNLLVNSSFESLLASWNTNPTATTQTATPAPFDGSRYFTAGAAASGFATQTVDLLAAGYSAAQLDSLDYVAAFGGRIRSAAETPRDIGQITLQFLNGASGLIEEVTVTATNSADRWELVGDRVQLPASTRYITYQFESTRASGATDDSFLDAAFLRVEPDWVAADGGAFGNTYLDAPVTGSLPPRIALRSPDLYADWERDQPHAIRWETYGNTAELPVRIDLYQDGPHGPALLTTIAASIADTGEFVWTPANSSIDYGTGGLRIQVQLVGENVALDRSTETFTVPENTPDFYVNDRDGSATAGDNRNTGKLASAPKPFPNNVVRIYALGPTHTLHVDAGDYKLYNTLLIGDGPDVGNDEGFVLTGPGIGQTALLRHANPQFTSAPIIELSDADFMTLSHLTTDGGTYGLLIRNGSVSFVGEHLTVAHASLDGLRFESSAPGSTLDHITSTANGRYGIVVEGPIDHIFDSDIGFNLSLGIYLASGGFLPGYAMRLEANNVHDNRASGIYVNNTYATTTIGNEDVTLGRGNIVRNNAGSGIEAFNGVTIVAGNAVSGNTQHGIYATGVVRKNVVFDNFYGISGGGPVVEYNRVYNNRAYGIYAGNSAITGNVVYGNGTAENSSLGVGIDVLGGGATLRNNLVYGNTAHGIRVRTNSVSLINNTVHQAAGNAVDVGSQVVNLQLRNNIFWVTSGYAVFVPSNSQNGFQSDYNLLYATGNGQIGNWQGAGRATLTAWRNATFTDQNSLSQDPQFVDFVDYHEKSLYGSYHGAALAPGLGVISGLPELPAGTLTPDGSQSPAIDRGLALDPYGNEVMPNGGFINIGAYGNTSLASLSPAQYVLVTLPDGGEIWPAGQNFPIRWRSHDFTGDVRIELLDANDAVELVIADPTPNDGEYVWAIPGAIDPGNYRVRVSRLDVGMQSDTSNNQFTIPEPVSIYYVNDNTVEVGDWTIAPGDDANDGLSPATPKASIRAMLEAYDLGPGDTIRVDAGTYNLTANILITPDDSGVRIEGFHTTTLESDADPFADNRSLRTVINRGNTTGGSYNFQFTGADDVTLSHLAMTGGEYAVVALSGADSDRITVEHNEFYGIYRGGVYTDSSNESQLIIGNRIFGSLDGFGTGITLYSTSGAVVSNNSVFNMFYGIGIEVRSVFNATTPSAITNNSVYYVTTGIAAIGNAGGTITVSGNDVHDTRFTGIQGNLLTLVTGNTVHDNPTGISAPNVRDNVVYSNQTGIDIGGDINALAQNNRVFNNSIGGIITSGGLVQSNEIYSNNVGVRLSGTGRVANNLIYDNSNDGIWVWYGSFGRVENNTVYQNGGGDAIQIGGPHPEFFVGTFAADRTAIINNILHVEQGYAMNFAADSGTGSTVNYNNLHITETGKLGRWQNRDFTELADWFYELGFDQHSQTFDPQLVNPAGVDGLMGYRTTPVGAPIVIDSGNAGFSVSGPWQDVPNGGAFFENSTGNNNAAARWVPIVNSKPYPGSGNLFVDLPISANWNAHPGLGSATYSYTTTASYTVTYNTGLGNYNVPYNVGFSGTVGTINQATAGNGWHSIGLLHLGFTDHYAQFGFVSVTPITLTTTLRINSTANVIADAVEVDGMTADNSDIEFNKEGFNWIPVGRDGDYYVRGASTDQGAASWEFTGLTPGAYYDVAAFWTAMPGNSSAAEFSIFDGDQAVRMVIRNQFNAPTSFADAENVVWDRLGYVKVTGDRLVVKLSGVGKLQADAVRIQQVIGDGSADNDFLVTPSSPTIDAGNPITPFANEPAANGARVNLGHTGNTIEATTSPAQFVQVLSPNGLEKFEQSQQVSIQWRSFGLPTTPDANALLNESPLVYYRFDETTGTMANDSSANALHGTYTGGVTLGVAGGLSEPTNYAATFDGSNDYVSVPSPGIFATSQLSLESWIKPDPTIPNASTVAMKSTSANWNDGYGMFWLNGKLRFWVNHYNSTNTFVEATVPTGAWSHVAGTYDGTAIKLYVNGVLVAISNYSAPIIHSAQPLQIGRGGGNSFYWKGGLDEVAVYGTALGSGAIQDHYLHADSGTASLELVNSQSMATTPIAAGIANDGEFTWTIPADLPVGEYLIRVTADAGISPSDATDSPILITNAGQHYYVNDASTDGDVFTSAVGSNANSGKTADAPMASIGALLTAYDMNPGDVIHVDAGTYNLIKNIVLDASDSGVRIEGPGATGSASVATLNRGSTVAGNFVIQLTGADDVTLDYLNITGGEYGIVATDSSDSDRLVVTNSEIHDNSRVGIHVGTINDDSRIEGNLLYNNRQGGVTVWFANGAHVRDNELFNNNIPGFGGTGIMLINNAANGNKSIVSENEVYGNDLGISVNGTTLIEVTNNIVHNNYSGITASNNVLVTNNVSYTNQGYHWSIGYGLSITNATAENNVVYDNDRGIDTGGAATIRNNRVFDNRDIGIQGSGSTVIDGNRIYGNSLGIRMTNNLVVLNNLLYDNPNDAIWVWSSSGGRIENNTIYQSTAGDAIQVAGLHPEQNIANFPVSNLTIKNNILRVAQGYAIHVAADSEIGMAFDYNDFVITGTGMLGRWEDRDFTSLADWFFELGYDGHSIAADPQFVDIDGADNKLGFDTATNTDYGLDDDFRVMLTSPTIDAGDPRSAYLGEPVPNGGRVNLGHTGNTLLAATSPIQIVQVLSPNGLEKYEVGQQVPIQWRSDGLTSTRAAALIDASGPGSGSWSANAYQTAGQVFSFTTPVNLSGVTNPAPASTYQVGTYGGYGVGNLVKYQLPASDGNYTLRLHFVEPSLNGPGQRLFDIKLNGITVQSNFDIFAVAGGANRATTLSFNVAASGGEGILLEMVNPSNTYGAFVTGIELTAANPLGVPNPTVDIDLSTNGGTNWTTIAEDIAMDLYGNGSYLWTAGPETNGNTALFRVRANNGTFPQDVSDSAFLITNAGNHYYVNDGSLAGDVFASAVGNNLNSGKSPSAPMSSLRALLAAYDLDAGDVIHVDAGTYRHYQNLVLDTQDSGVRIEGPGATPEGLATGAVATLNRGNTNSARYVIEMTGADDVTLDHLAITGGSIGVLAANGVQSDRLTVSNSDIFANIGSTGSVAYGIYVGAGNADAYLLGNRVHGNLATTSGGIVVEAARGRIEDNEVFGNVVGINASYFGLLADRIIVSGNRAHGNTSIGIFGHNQVLVTGNTAYEQLAANAIGIQVRASSQSIVATDNIVYDNFIGLLATSDNSVSLTATNNRAFNNSVGIRASGVAQILGNQSYSNAVGISGHPSSGFNGFIANNVVYANTNQGIFIESSFIAGGKIVNNTVFQPVGEAIRLNNVSQGMTIRNNIVWVDSGYAIYVAPNSQANISSNYNLIQLSADPNAHVGFWGNAARHTLADWQAAASQDAASLVADPLFVDRNGSDNVLGYRSSDAYDGGLDDNFLLRANSPAIDRGESTLAPTLDRLGNARVDDPGTPNLGAPPALAYVDLGAYEFQGSSLDVTPPVILSTTPSAVHGGTSVAPFDEITISFSEPLNPIDAASAGNYELRSAGSNGSFDDLDDTIFALVPAYTTGATTVGLAIAAGELPAGLYRLTVFGGVASGLHDLAGLLLDGDDNGTASGDYVRSFTVSSETSFAPGDYNRDGDVDQADHDFWTANFDATSGMGLQADGNSSGRVNAADYTIWRNNLGASQPVIEPLSLLGDYDRNDAVEPADHEFWTVNFGATSGPGLQADGNGNGIVDLGDYPLWRNNLGKTASGSASHLASSTDAGSTLGKSELDAAAESYSAPQPVLIGWLADAPLAKSPDTPFRSAAALSATDSVFQRWEPLRADENLVDRSRSRSSTVRLIRTLVTERIEGSQISLDAAFEDWGDKRACLRPMYPIE